MTTATRTRKPRRATEAPKAETLPDELNPAYLFQGKHTALLVRIATGDLNAQALAIDTLADLGLHPSTGTWVGFEMARKVADRLKDQHGIL